MGPAPPPRGSPRCLVQRERPQRCGGPGELREQGAQRALWSLTKQKAAGAHRREDRLQPAGAVPLGITRYGLPEPGKDYTAGSPRPSEERRNDLTQAVNGSRHVICVPLHIQRPSNAWYRGS